MTNIINGATGVGLPESEERSVTLWVECWLVDEAREAVLLHHERCFEKRLTPTELELDPAEVAVEAVLSLGLGVSSVLPLKTYDLTTPNELQRRTAFLVEVEKAGLDGWEWRELANSSWEWLAQFSAPESNP